MAASSSHTTDPQRLLCTRNLQVNITSFKKPHCSLHCIRSDGWIDCVEMKDSRTLKRRWRWKPTNGNHFGQSLPLLWTLSGPEPCKVPTHLQMGNRSGWGLGLCAWKPWWQMAEVGFPSSPAQGHRHPSAGFVFPAGHTEGSRACFSCH